LYPHPNHRPIYQKPSDSGFGLRIERTPLATSTIATLRVLRLANSKEILRRDWLKEDPIVNDLTILKRAAGTNFNVPDKHRMRLQALWTKTGTDWTYPECVAGLWAFHRTYGKEVSKLPGSPVSEVSLKIGRVAGGVYNKVMNFRALDPRDERTGLPGTGENDKRIWRKFYDETIARIRAEELVAEYSRLWEESTELLPCDLSSANGETFEHEVRVQQKRTLADLLRDYEASKPVSHATPPRRAAVPSTQFERDPKVAAIAKVRAGFRCELASGHGSATIALAAH
jgi:hypothetical protein